jgi:hypothetical protein
VGEDFHATGRVRPTPREQEFHLLRMQASLLNRLVDKRVNGIYVGHEVCVNGV